MSALRTFLHDVLGVRKPNGDQSPSRQGVDQAQEPQVGPAELPAKLEQENSAGLNAQIKKRLAAVIDSVKKAVTDNGPDAQQLQIVFNMIKTSVAHQQLTDAQEELDLLEDLLDEHASPAQAPDSIGLDDGAETEDAGAPDSGADDDIRIEEETPRPLAENRGREGESASDAARNKGIETGIDAGLSVLERVIDSFALEATCLVSNNTRHILQLDPSSLAAGTGTFKKFPPSQIRPGEQDVEIVAENLETLRIHYGTVAYSIKYFIDEQTTTTWTLQFRNTVFGHRKKKGKHRKIHLLKRPECKAPIDGPDAGKFLSEATRVPGKKGGFYFTLNPIGGPILDPEKPDPDKPNPPGSQPEIKASCLITVTNDTQVELKLTSQDNDRGEFQTSPALSIGPGQSDQFTYVTTSREPERDKQGCKGSVTYAAGSPLAAVWRCEWENLVGEKNTAHASLDPETAGLESVEQPGPGDENVPFLFTISGGSEPSTPELPFDPPKPAQQPTLRLGDNNADGWVEYLQQQLNMYQNAGLTVDGNFGPATLKAVFAFQEKMRIDDPSFLVDGIVGNQTWAALRNEEPAKPDTDHQTPHSFLEKGAEARWLREKDVVWYIAKSDELILSLVSVGDKADLEGKPVNVFVTPPHGEQKGQVYRIGPMKSAYKTSTDQGNLYDIIIANFTKTYPSERAGAKIEEYVIDAYFDNELGRDRLKAHPAT